jgi:putative tryptophan/tyrosine transport system substrate-binding protein
LHTASSNGDSMKRREFLTLIGGASAAWPFAAQAQQPGATRRIGALMNFSSEAPEGQGRIAAFKQALQKLGWNDGDNVRIDIRWAADDVERFRKYSEELVELNPDVILASASASVAALQRITRSVPIVFANAVDPVGAGYITSLARPGGNTTGFTSFEYSIGGKWLELLKQIAPRVTRIAVIRDPAIAAGIGQFAAIQGAASSAVELSVIDPRDVGELKRALDAFAGEPNGGLIATASSSVTSHYELINSLALRHRLPAVHPFRYSVLSGGVASYGPNTIDIFRRAAAYVDRILKGAKPSELPVQAPNKYELVINLKAAKTLGLEIPPALLATADEVIE